MIGTLDGELQLALDVATELAARAGAATLPYFRSDVQVQRKAGSEPVTQADRDAQAVILDGLRRFFPSYGVLAEESEEQASWADHRRAWVVDPLDGTQDFIAGYDGFSVMIGLLEERRPILGVVHRPVRALTYRAVVGHGAEIVQGDQRLPLRPTATAALGAIRLVVSKSHRSTLIDDAKRALQITDEENIGSVGLKIGLIARGERDLYLNPEGHCRLWDTCAPEAILVEAGGRMTDLHGDPLRYQPGELHVRGGIVASNGACHAAVLQALAPLFPRQV
jgi:3'(2'), 5'-bisphosphate nucleotidase